MIKTKDTICAIATPIGEGGISIIRISGAQSFSLVDGIFRSVKDKKVAEAVSHSMLFGVIIENDTVLDQVLVAVFRSPHSYTTEDTVEIHTHGGIVITQKILDIVVKAGARLAEPGEFTKRAFLNGRIDLTQAEAVLDIIQAKTERSARTSMQVLQGMLREKIASIKDSLLHLLAHIESFVDFPDEDDELFEDVNLSDEFNRLCNDIDALRKTYEHGELLRNGVHTVLVGRPNVGKSSLLNTLLNRDRAIVSSYPGTTRDAIEELIDIEGILFRIVDTAGVIEKPNHELDFMSVQKTREHYEQGDVIIFIFDGSVTLTDEDYALYKQISDKKVVTVINKCDQEMRIDTDKIREWNHGEDIILLSTITKQGIPELEKKLIQSVWSGEVLESDCVIVRLRHKKALDQAYILLTHAATLFADRQGLECIAYDVRDAIKTLRELIGDVYSDDVLNLIFDEFCIGK